MKKKAKDKAFKPWATKVRASLPQQKQQTTNGRTGMIQDGDRLVKVKEVRSVGRPRQGKLPMTKIFTIRMDEDLHRQVKILRRKIQDGHGPSVDDSVRDFLRKMVQRNRIQ